MKKWNLRQLLFLAICCNLGLFSKRIITPITHLVADMLRIPDGVSTGFSLMFLVVATDLTSRFGSATIMSCVQGALAVAFGMVGAMGAFTPLSYILPGILIDCTFWLGRQMRLYHSITIVAANMLGCLAACMTANVVVLHLQGFALWLYLASACMGGIGFGLLGIRISRLVAGSTRLTDSTP